MRVLVRTGLNVVGSMVMVAAIALSLAGTSAAQDRPSLDFLDVPERPTSSTSVAPERLRGLEEIEAELVRFDASAQAYRRSIDGIVLRRLRARRQALATRYDRSLRIERGLEEGARERTIAELTAFLRHHPAAGDHEASAMLRLAELHMLRALDALDREDAERPDFAEAIAIARRLVQEHPRYRHVDHAAYLLGYALSEMGRPEEALVAWRALVCANRSSFESAAMTLPSAPELRHPALGAEEGRAPAIGASPYDGCVPAVATELASEVWLRIGEHHFEGALGELAAAIGAYEHVVADPSHALYSFGLYKLAWAHYRASHFVEAIEHFARLVTWSDARREATGRAGSDLRVEALQYIAITLAHEDWDEDGVNDRAAGGPGTLERAADPALLPGAPWASEALRELGQVLFEEARYPEAITAWRLALARARSSCDAPDVLLSIARAERRIGSNDAAFEVLHEIPALLSSPSWGSTCDAAGRERAERIAERTIASVAAHHHQRAQALRAAERADLAYAEYSDAARVYRLFLERFPSSPASYAMRYDLADALYWSGRHAQAAAEYEAVRDSRHDDRLAAPAARRAVESRTRELEADVRSGALVLRTAPPAPTAGGPVEPVAVPVALQRVARAREIYVRWIPAARDAEGVRDAYAFNNAMMLSQYGFLPEARERFSALYEARCRGPRASRTGADAFFALRDIAVARGELDEAARLLSDVRERECTFDPEAAPVLEGACTSEGGLPCDLREFDADVRFALLEREARALTLSTDPEVRRARAETIARRLLSAVDAAPSHPDAPVAIARAGQLLFEEAGRLADAERAYQRLIDDVTPLARGDRTRRAELDPILAEAHLELARIAHRTFDVERALAAYAVLTDAERFAGSSDPRIRRMRSDALLNAALLASSAGQHGRAASAWRRASSELAPAEAREALLRASEERLAAGDARAAARELDAWLDAHGASADAFTLRAHVARAEAAARIGDRASRERSLEAAVRAHRASGARREAPETRVAAQAALSLADLRAAARTPTRIRVGSQPTGRGTVDQLERQVGAELLRRRAHLDAYDVVIAMGRAEESVAALGRQGAIHEDLVRTILESDVQPPRDFERAIARATPDVRRELRERYVDSIRTQLDALVRPSECRAIERYLLAARLALRSTLASEDAEAARERLSAYGEERVSECLREAQERDPTLEPYQPGELHRARPGLVPAPSEGTAPPALDH